MAKVLEALIAKGRRVRRPREQKEVAFGLCDLSTHEELHERIVKKGGVKSLLNLLTHSQDAEAQRFSALGVVEKAVLATAAALGFVLFVFLLIPTGPTPTYVIAAPPPAA